MSIGSFAIVAVGTGINLTKTIQEGRDPFPVIIGGVLFGVACSAMDDLSGKSLGKAMALVFLLSSFILNGTRLIDGLESVMKSPKPPTAPATLGSSGGSGLRNAAPGSGAGGSSSGSF